MISRDHPFNQSTRPLLAERKPQLQLIKKKTDTKLHGFNDFDIISQQYRNLTNHHIGYPYGSPPSPTANSNDFVFSDDNHIINNTLDLYNNFNINNINSHHSTSTPNRNYNTISSLKNDNNNCNIIGVDNIHDGGIVDDDDGLVENFHNVNNVDNNEYYHKQLRIENNSNNWFINHNSQNHHHNHNNQISSAIDHDESSTGGPFIFGIHTAANTFIENNKKNTSVINSTKYSTDKGLMPVVINQSNSDTSSSSRDTQNECKKILIKSRKGNKKKNCKEKIKKKSKPRIKCVLVGDGAVGKTNLIISYLENRFIKEHVPTASDIYNAEVMVNDSPVYITLCDTAGQDSLDPLRELCYPDSDVFLLCFSVVKPETFRSIKTKWTPKFSKSKAALILVGTQADLRNDKHVLNKLQIQGEKPISFTDAWDLATSIGAKYIETSSFTQDKIKDVFDAAIWDALLPKHLPPTPPFWKKLFCLV